MLLQILSGRCSILENGDEFVTVFMSNGWCAAITIDPERPLEKWRCICLGHEPTEFEAAQRAFKTLAVGLYEAHTNSKTGTSLVVYFEITDTGELEIIGTRGDEDLVLAKLNWLTLDELFDARESAGEEGGLPPLEGSFKQTEGLRAGRIAPGPEKPRDLGVGPASGARAEPWPPPRAVQMRSNAHDFRDTTRRSRP